MNTQEQVGQRAYEIMPHIPRHIMEAIEGAINARNGKPEQHVPVFLSRKHLLAEVAISLTAYHILKRFLTNDEKTFCFRVAAFVGNHMEDVYDISHIEL